MATNFYELATTVKYLGAEWLVEKKINSLISCAQFYIEVARKEGCYAMQCFMHLPDSVDTKGLGQTDTVISV